MRTCYVIFIFIYLFIYLLYRDLHSSTAGSPRINAKERDKKDRQGRRTKKRKVLEAQRAKPQIPSWAIDAFIKEEEQNRTGKKNKETGNGPHNPAKLDHQVTFYDPHGAYGQFNIYISNIYIKCLYEPSELKYKLNLNCKKYNINCNIKKYGINQCTS